jgi:hypothetical protein
VDRQRVVAFFVISIFGAFPREAENTAKSSVAFDDGQESLVFVPKGKAETEYQFLKPGLKELLRDLHAKHRNQPFSFTQGHDDSPLAKSTYMDRLLTLVRRGLITKTSDDQYRLTDEAIAIVTHQ